VSANPQAVRPATPADIEALCAVVPSIIAENTILPPSPGRIQALINRCVFRVGGSLAGIIDGDDGIAASIGLCFAEDHVSDMPYVMTVWCGLAPEVRRVSRHVPIDDPRRHYGKRLFEFARWFHEGMEQVAEHPVLVQFNVLTTEGLAPKMGLYSRNLLQIGGVFALGANGAFRPQEFPAEVAEVAA
jgi:hypothetical protein